MTHVRSMRLVCSGFWADVRLTQVRGRWIASADTPDGPSVGLAWFPIDALEQALEPFDGLIADRLQTAPDELS